VRQGWQRKKLGDVCCIEKAKYQGSNLPFVGLEDIEGGTGRFLGELSPKSVESGSFHFTPDHLLFGRLRPYLNKVLKPDFEGHCSSEIFPIRPLPAIDRSFLQYWLMSGPVVREIDRTSTGARMPRANVNAVLDFDAPLPPLPEQKRIVAVLDEAFQGIDRAVANTEKNLANARELFESYLNAVFSEAGDQWTNSKVSELAQHCLGKMLDKKKNKGILRPYLRNLNVRWFEFDLRDVLEMRFENHEVDRFSAKKGDLLICEGGYPGRAAVWNSDKPVFFQKAIHRVRFPNPSQSIWLAYFLYHLTARNRLANFFTGAGIQHFTKQTLADLRLPLPPHDELELHLKELDELRGQCAFLEVKYAKKKNALAGLKQSILHKAFAGEPTAEPVLAEAVLAEAGA